MNVLLWIVFGGVAGWVASLIVGADAELGLIGNVVIGIIGAFIGGWVAAQFDGGTASAERPTSLTSFFWAVIGAILILVLLNLLFRIF